MGNRLILVGDNPFHGVSHVSRERSLLRSGDVLDAKRAAELVVASVRNGADGFTFTVSETTLSILREISNGGLSDRILLFPLVPNVNELVRTAGTAGGMPGLAKSTARKMASYISAHLLGYAVKGVVWGGFDQV